MSNNAARAKALKEIFEAAKNAPRHNGFIKDRGLHHDLDDAMFAVGKERLYELKDEIFPFLKDDNPYFREAAIRVLGYDNDDGLNLPEIKELAYDFWLNDPDDNVRVAALDEWGKCYAFSKDPIILKYLYNIFYSDRYSSNARMRALLNFIYIADEGISIKDFDDIFDLSEIKDSKLFLQAMNSRFSSEISKIMNYSRLKA